MADPIAFIITNAGLDALVDAEAGDTDPIMITQVGLSEAAVLAAPSLEVLLGEFKRLDTVSGMSIAPNIIHMTAQDPSEDIYELRSLALYLADGTLFASYGQEDPLFTKVSIASFMLALDVAFSGDVAESIEFGDATFVNPTATETVKGVAELATQGETDAGLDDSRIVTPLKLKTLLDAITAALGGAIGVVSDAGDAVAAALAALLARTITGGGLATGGGNLNASRVITVPAANEAETIAAVASDKAVVPSGLATILGILDAAADNIAALFARTITGAGLATGGGDLTANRVITVPAANEAETIAAAIGDKAVVPSGLATILGILDDAADDIATLFARTIDGGGLVTGGGDLTADRTVTVTAATGAEIATGTEAGKAVTPEAIATVPQSFGASMSVIGLGGAITKGGSRSGEGAVSFPVAFPNACDRVQLTFEGDANDGDEDDEPLYYSGLSASGFTINIGGDHTSPTVGWVAWGW